MEAQEAQRREDRLLRRNQPSPPGEGVDTSLAYEACGGGSISYVGSRLCCLVCHVTPCHQGCMMRTLSHRQQAEYEWLLAKRGGCVPASASQRVLWTSAR